MENEGPVTVTVRLLEGTLETTVSVNLHTSGATATRNDVINMQKHNLYSMWECMVVWSDLS